jgi:anti-anti-sigma factor
VSALKGRIVGGHPLLEQVTLGDHVCWYVDDDAIRMEAIAGFVRTGLRNRERVLYSGDDPEAVVAGLARHGIDTRELAAGDFEAGTAESSYLAGGSFDPVATLLLWRTEITRARSAGYRGIRVLGDMTWASRRYPGAEHLAWYEAQVNMNFVDGYVAGVCAYDRRRFDPMHLRRLLWAHPGAAGSEMPFDPGSSLRVRRVDDPWGLRLEGEADLSNRDALRAVVEHLFDDHPEVTIDVAGLRFADLAAARLLVDAAASGIGQVRLTGVSPSLLRLLSFHGAEGVAALTVEAR